MLEAMQVKKLPQAGRAIVRILPQPLYDTEVLKAATATSELNFYAKPIGQSDASAVITSKSLSHTNLKQAAQLAKPYEFDLFSFNVKLSGQTTTALLPADFFRIIQDGFLEFSLGNRVYLQCPIRDFPAGVCPEGFGSTTADTGVIIHSGVGHRSNTWKFTVGKYLVHIRSTESFSVRLAWSAAITCTNNIFVQMYMNGLLYNAI